MNNGYDNRSAIADIYIPSTKKFTVNVTVYGSLDGGYAIKAIQSDTGKFFKARSSAIISECNQHRPKTAFRQFVYGQREHDDALLYFGKEYVTPNDRLYSFKRFPRYMINFDDKDRKLTSVIVRMNVSKIFQFY